MKLKIFVLFLLIFSSVFGQDIAAKLLLDKVSSSYNNVDSYTMKFEYSFFDKNGKTTLKNNGALYASKEKYYLALGELNQIYNGKKLYTINNDDKEVTIQTADINSDDFLSPNSILKKYRNGYKYNLTKASYPKTVVLIPEENNANIKSITININEKDLLIDFIQLNNDGTKLVVKIVKYIENVKMTSEIFKFDKNRYPNYYLTDFD